VDEQALEGVMPILEIKIQLGHQPNRLVRQLAALKIKGQTLLGQTGNGPEAGRLPV
jgi:hypothetical protein